jgi:2-keto-3-deoxy-L-rhamnonate aldolase RhmA
MHTVTPALVEMIGHTGMYDYVELVTEYATYDLHDLDNFCRAAELYDLSSMIKVDYDTRQYTAQRAIGAGFQGVLFVDNRTVEDARQCVRAAPKRRRRRRFALSLAALLPGLWRLTPVRAGAADVVVVLMIEKAAVEH